MEFLNNFFSTSQFIPHGHCYLWKPGLVWLHLISDVLTGLAYYSIPVMLVYFVRKRRDMPFGWIFLMFSTFIVACGTTHLMDVWTLWYPTYWLSGLLKAITAFVSVLTAIQLVPLMPQVLALSNPAQLEAANYQLAREIAERIRTEEVLRESEQRWQLALRGNNDGIWDWNVKTNEVFFSARWKEMLGYEDNEISNHLDECVTRVHPNDLDWVKQAVQDHFAQKTPFYIAEYRALCKDGTYKWILDRGQALWDEDGNVVRMAGSHTDITDRKQAEETLNSLLNQLESMVEERTAELTKINKSLQTEITERQRIEEALRESEQRFRAAFHQAAVGIAHIAIDGSWLLVNQKLCDLLGYTLEELQLLTFQDITHPDDLNTNLKYVEQILADNIQTYSMEKRYFRKDNSIVWVNLTVSLMRESSGEPKYFISVVEDINERKAAQRERKQWEEQIKASLLEKEVLLKEIYHRVKNNLQVISSLLNLQSAYIKDKEDLVIFQQSQQRIASMALVHEKLYQSQDLAKINFGEYIRDLVASLFTAYEVDENAITLTINTEDCISLGLDTAIPCSLIIHELVSNSLKYAFTKGSNGAIHIEIKKIINNKLTLIVSDNGIGLPPNFDLKKLASLGWELVDALTHQLAGNINITGATGVECQVTFPLP
ncbi:PAS domain S-box protein [Nostoc sp. 'Lobaria pulmonaria (5183) cyanobiont']|uniref:PAS domain S-box protein n=1 Tax=Nostoc sp. 'Lobaria pulmonaria (5183) cyanobiont' TaxID=1618022 RepID=UPI000CF337C5|nr:PAS domain S-box protein [Nostoc sp. 'Lobaria pulmonaria (5183) cyanobiont']AVH73677.1 histidine kinase [Nostoc sp. 'Lobaria pulmonaria (5183) cyanobiont']